MEYGIKMKNKEIWKDIKNYEGLYQVSNLGRVKSLYKKQETILKYQENKSGYLKVVLYKEHKGKIFYIHRLVAQVFILNKNNYNQINHKDKNKQNNNVDNLEWCDRQYNIEYSKAIKVNQYDKNGNFIKTHKSIASASRELNIKSNYHISYCCKGKEKSCGGYIWKYYDKEEVE